MQATHASIGVDFARIIYFATEQIFVVCGVLKVCASLMFVQSAKCRVYKWQSYLQIVLIYGHLKQKNEKKEVQSSREHDFKKWD